MMVVGACIFLVAAAQGLSFLFMAIDFVMKHKVAILLLIVNPNY